MNYGELKSAIADYMHRPDLTAQIPLFVEQARTRINRDLRAREMVTRQTLTPGANPFPLPADFLEMIDISYVRRTQRVSLRLSPMTRINEYDRANTPVPFPEYYSINGTEIVVSPNGEDQEYTLIYYAAEPKLIDDSDEPITLESFPSLWLHGSLIEAHAYTQDEELRGTATQVYTSEITRLNEIATDAMSGAALQMKGASSWL